MLTVVYTNFFLKSAGKLPKPQQNKLAQLLEIIQNNPFNPKLHSKALTGPLTGLYSFRITRDWRVIFQFLNPDTVKLIDIGHRKNIYKNF